MEAATPAPAKEASSKPVRHARWSQEGFNAAENMLAFRGLVVKKSAPCWSRREYRRESGRGWDQIYTPRYGRQAQVTPSEARNTAGRKKGPSVGTSRRCQQETENCRALKMEINLPFLNTRKKCVLRGVWPRSRLQSYWGLSSVKAREKESQNFPVSLPAETKPVLGRGSRKGLGT